MKKLIIAILAVLLCFYSPQSPLNAAIERFQNRMEYRFSEEQLRFITYWSQELRLETEEDVYQFIVDTGAFYFIVIKSIKSIHKNCILYIFLIPLCLI